MKNFCGGDDVVRKQLNSEVHHLRTCFVDKNTPLSSKIKFTVKSHTGETITFSGDDRTAIRDIRPHVEKKFGCPLPYQRFFFDGQELHDDSIIRHCN